MAKYEIKDGVGIIPDGETTIADMAFWWCEELTKVVIPSSVTTIGREAFKDCKNLESIEIPSNVTSIYAYAFAGCSALKSIKIHKNISSIGFQAFDRCGALTSIVVEEGNSMYDSRNNCNAVIDSATNTLLRGCCNTTIPEGTEVINSFAFSMCKGLTSIVIPESVKKIGDNAFFCCHDLTSIVIPKSVTEISKYGVFSHCESLTSIVVEEGNSIYDSRENCNAIIKNGTTLVAGCSNSFIPNGVEKLEVRAFSGCVNLTNIVIPASVTEIGANAFGDCTALTEIVIPDSVEYIGVDAFYNSGLTSIEVPESVKDLNAVFMNCEKLKTATVKGKLEDYRPSCVFPFQGCPALETLTFLDCVRYMKEESCNGCKSLKNIYVPAKKGDYYKKRFDEKLHPLIVELEAKKKKTLKITTIKKQATYGDYTISIAENNSVSVVYQGDVFDKTKAALREIADQAGFAYEKAWNTQQFGSKLVDFLNANPTQASASKSEPNKSQKQHIRVEVEMTEHDYAAFDSEEDMTDSFAFYSVEQIRIFVDGEDIEFDDWGFDGDTFTDYEPFDLKEKWDNDDIVKFGYYENKVETVWEFDVENFDIKKLAFVHQCFDVTYDPADYNCEEDWLTLHYDSQSLEDNIVASNTSDGDFQQKWSMCDDEDDCNSDFAEDEEEEEDVEARLNNKYDQVFQDGDIYSVEANGKWGFVDKDGKELIAPRYDWMGDEFVEGVIIVGYDGGGIGYANDEGVEIVAPKYEQACDFCNGFAAVRLNNKWGFIDKSGKEVVEIKYNDVDIFKNGKAKVTLNEEEFEIDTQGNRIDSDR